MLNEKLLNALNRQMNHEFFAAHAYMAMASYCDYHSYEGFANFYIQQAKEERFHGQKIYDYINDRGEQAFSVNLTHQKLSSTAFLKHLKTV